MRFQALTNARKLEYHLASQQHEKNRIVREVVQIVEAAQGRFLRKIETLMEAHHFGVPLGVQAWLPVEEEVILEEVKQAMRDTNEEGQLSRTQGAFLDTSAADVSASPAYNNVLHYQPQDALQQTLAGQFLGGQQ